MTRHPPLPLSQWLYYPSGHSAPGTCIVLKQVFGYLSSLFTRIIAQLYGRPPTASQSGRPAPPVQTVAAPVSLGGSCYLILSYPRDYKRLFGLGWAPWGAKTLAASWWLSLGGNPPVPSLLSFGAPLCFPRGFGDCELLFCRRNLSGLGRFLTF